MRVYFSQLWISWKTHLFSFLLQASLFRVFLSGTALEMQQKRTNDILSEYFQTAATKILFSHHQDEQKKTKNCNQYEFLYLRSLQQDLSLLFVFPLFLNSLQLLKKAKLGANI